MSAIKESRIGRSSCLGFFFAVLFLTTSAFSQTILVSFGSGSFSVDTGAVVGDHKQSELGISFAPVVSLGDTVGGVIRPIQLPGTLSGLGLMMRLSGTNPDLPFSIETFDSNFNVTAKFQGQTAGVGNAPMFVPLKLVEGSPQRSPIAGLQLTWDGGGPINIEVRSLAVASSPTPDPSPTPAPTPQPTPQPTPLPTPLLSIDRKSPTVIVTVPKSLSASTRAPKYTIKGIASDNVSPTRLQLRVRVPGAKSYGRWTTINLAKGSAKMKPWSHSVALNRKGTWLVQIRILDARGNVSTVRTLRIKRT